jgi:carbon-monoxide dehydrogenase small subunit
MRKSVLNLTLFRRQPRGKIHWIWSLPTAVPFDYVIGGENRPRKDRSSGRISRRNVMAAVAMTVNGKAVTGDTDPRTLLVQYLREELRLTGTHVGCDTSQCGACVVHVNGKAVKSCTVFAWQIDGADVLTIEGLAAPNGPLHPMQEAFREHHGLQCGYCTPGMIMSAIDIVNRKGHELDDETIRHELEGNLCRCTGYHNIVKAIAAGARAMGPDQATGTRAAE